MAILNIAGANKTNLVDWKSVKREQVLSKESDKLSFLIRKHNGQTYKPTSGDEVTLETGTSTFTTRPTDGTRSNHTGSLGFQFTVTTSKTVNRLGRQYASTNTLNHVVNLWNADTAALIATGTVLASSSSDALGFKWVDVTPVVLSPGVNYTIGVDETSGVGEVWKDQWNPAGFMVGSITVIGARYSNTVSVRPTFAGTAGQIYNTPAMTFVDSKEFGGYIVEIEEEVDARVEYIRCICKDYTHDLDRQLVSKTYEAMTVNAIIADLIGTFATGITDNNVNCPITLDSVTFNYLPISRCLTRLTELVDGFEWYIDYDKDIHFFETASTASAFDLTDTSGNYAYNSLSIREDTHQLRNEVIIRGGLLTSTTLRTEYLSGDGTKDVFPLATKFANLPTVEVASVAKTVGVENIDPAGFDCYWNYNEKSLKFVTPPAAGTSNITVEQYPQYPLILQKRNEASITTYGLFQHVIVDKNIRDLDTAGLRADVELLRYSTPEKSANFLTYTAGLMTGQTINVQSTIRGIDEDFKIQSIRSYLRTPNTDELTHEVECVTAEDIGINDILARLLITNPSDQIEIQEGEFIERIRQLTESFAITDSTPTATEITGPFLYGTAIMGFSTWA